VGRDAHPKSKPTNADTNKTLLIRLILNRFTRQFPKTLPLVSEAVLKAECDARKQSVPGCVVAEAAVLIIGVEHPVAQDGRYRWTGDHQYCGGA
ncbi:hypothetical protein, partial [Mesorhizobium wenxiniae]|uniref:hypothetical protein n=1 Tax=Mesorhizobium wenxiniae TaxID=2014805 RepID=UPI00197E3CEE